MYSHVAFIECAECANQVRDEGKQIISGVLGEFKFIRCMYCERNALQHYPFVTIAVNISNVVAGIAMGWTSPMNPKLTVDGPENPLGHALSVDMLGWIGSLLAVGALIAPLIGGYLADKFGRKKMLLANSLFFIASFLLMGISPSLVLILVARLFQVSVKMNVQSAVLD